MRRRSYRVPPVEPAGETDSTAVRPDPAGPSGVDAETRRDWLALWDADRQSLADTGQHIETVMWSDDRAVGMRGWYY
jgi:hypothetical protein